MKHERCHDLIDYFNGALTQKEAAEFERHLADCKECREELEELQNLTEDLPFLSEPADPPAGLKSRILEAAYEEEQQEGAPSELEQQLLNKPIHNEPELKKPKRSHALLIGSLAAGLVLSLAANVIQLTEDKGESILQSEALQKKVTLASMEGQDSVNATASFLQEKDNQFMVLQADGLPEIKEGELYQVWLIKGDQPVPAGHFKPDENGNGALVYEVDNEEFDWDTVAITVENEPNLPAPRGKVLLAGKS
ncbi:anti-sigma factor [Metabacillus sp. 84]|uniref:anti-sigma factor n=1 Tax=Metabacillus sp. 84 TaxID=3404705 RepID=UPI003CF2E591